MSRVVPIGEAFREAFAHEAAGREAEALTLYQRILAAVPNHPGALLRIAEMELRHGDQVSAGPRLRAALDAAKVMQLPVADIVTALARLERSEGRVAEAKLLLEQALRDTPGHSGAMLELGVLEHGAGELAAAQARFRALTQRDPELGIAWLQLALVLEQQGELAAAREAAATAMTARNTTALAWQHASRLAWRAGDHDTAQALSMHGLARYPRDWGLLHQQGIVLKLRGRAEAACRVLEEAAALAPRDAGVRVTLGAACLDADRPADALRHLREALALGATSGEVWDNLGMAHLACGDSEAAQKAFEHAVALAPDLTPALANLVHLRQQNCAWEGLPALQEMLVATLSEPARDPRWPPFVALAMDLSPAQQLEVARRWSRAMLPLVSPPVRAGARRERLRIGYVSNEFREHATGRLMVGLFEAHDRSMFEVFGYGYGRDDGTALQRRIMSAFDTWRDVADLSDIEVAQRIRDDRIDVLIDCKGHTRGGRLGILSSRPAPVQLHYMGFPGSIGYDAIDGLIADEDVIPAGDEAHFHERIWRLPRCFFVNDARREIPVVQPRAAHGLPDDGLVLACFNQPYKITAPVFAIWMRALRSAPRAVLWLLATSHTQQRNLKAEAQRAGVDPGRILFARPLPPSAHLARVGCADLALDTLPVNQHTTACDALWAGVPMLTVRGKTFAGRVGASIVRAAKLPELVTESLGDYAARLLELIQAPDLLARYRAHLLARRLELPLFDTQALARDLEALLVQAYEETLAARR